MSGIACIFGLAAVIAAICGVAILKPERGPVMRKRRGIEMKAENGRLTHFRVTESEHEI